MTTEAAPTAKPRIEWVDTLRGLAAASVLFYHYCYLFKYQISFFDNTMQLGQFGVVLFFCVSGFIIPQSVREEGHEPAVKFLINRVFRLYPAYWLSILIALPVFFKSIPNTLVNLTMFQELIGQDSLQGVYWTLNVEFIYYAIVASLVFFRRKSDARAVAVIVFALCGLNLLFGFARFGAAIKAPVALSLGLLVIMASYYLRLMEGQRYRLANIAVLLVSAATVCACCYLSYSRDWGRHETPFKFVLTYLLAFGIYWVFFITKIASKIVSWFGKISYSVYLFHMPVTMMGISALDHLGVAKGLQVVICLAAVIGLSWLSFVLVEKPGMKLGKAIMPKVLAPVMTYTQRWRERLDAR